MLRFNAHMLTDRATGKTYAIHEDREKRFHAAMDAAGVDVLERFAPMGPTRLDAGEPCNFGGCVVGEE